MVRSPACLGGAVVTSKLFGDIINDELSIISASIGLLPSASLTRIPDGEYIPKPSDTILSVAIIFQCSFDLPEKANAVEGPVRVALDSDLRVTDFGGNTTTEEVDDAVFEELKQILKA
ncbi:3-isopropylmalate dehydrogenase [Fusarium phyllophilum]|uniref:3-isopropylmalate dehydrogenase n=1 Tax=Fusarium phyllophilum TaxID=47803 RepID=A0A8H5K988_9HYPO|nr:3-isopropylmalate dehydrogenase [Fusarium phyllophilum]